MQFSCGEISNRSGSITIPRRNMISQRSMGYSFSSELSDRNLTPLEEMESRFYPTYKLSGRALISQSLSYDSCGVKAVDVNCTD